jgi:hypothetical protein
MLVYVDVPDPTPPTHWTARAATAVAMAIHDGESGVFVDLPLRMTQDGTAISILRDAATGVNNASD